MKLASQNVIVPRRSIWCQLVKGSCEVLATDDLTSLLPPLRRYASVLTDCDHATADDLTQATVLDLLERPLSGRSAVKLVHYGRLRMRSIWHAWGFQAP